jgi:hypothetical protein
MPIAEVAFSGNGLLRPSGTRPGAVNTGGAYDLDTRRIVNDELVSGTR